jgi:hypothetical protein
MTVDASRSCLGLGACVASAIRQIVDARVFLTAPAPPALLGRNVSDGFAGTSLGCDRRREQAETFFMQGMSAAPERVSTSCRSEFALWHYRTEILRFRELPFPMPLPEQRCSRRYP